MSDTEKKHNNTENKPKYIYAEMMLREIKDEYLVENERERKISSKASAFITVIIAIIALYIPLIPFGNLKDFFTKSTATNTEKSWTVVFLILLSVGFMFMMIAFWHLIKAYSVKGYNHVNVDDLLYIANQVDKSKMEESHVYQGLVAHYHKILRGTLDKSGNKKINSDDADAIGKGITWIVIGFIIMSIATIALRILVVIP